LWSKPPTPAIESKKTDSSKSKAVFQKNRTKEYEHQSTMRKRNSTIQQFYGALICEWKMLVNEEGKNSVTREMRDSLKKLNTTQQKEIIHTTFSFAV
jgi:hypothetical protein